MENGCWRPSSIRSKPGTSYELYGTKTPPLKGPIRLAGRINQAVDALHVKAQEALRRAKKVFNKDPDEKPRDMSGESYGRRVAYRRSSFGSTVGVQKRDPLIDIRPPRDTFLVTQTHGLLNVLNSTADSHHKKTVSSGPPKVPSKFSPPVLLAPFSLHIKRRPLPRSYYLGGSLVTRRESQMLKAKVKAEVQERESVFVPGIGVRVDGTRSSIIPEGLGYQNARKNVLDKIEEYHANYQSRRELQFRAQEHAREKRKSRMSLLQQNQERRSLLQRGSK